MLTTDTKTVQEGAILPPVRVGSSSTATICAVNTKLTNLTYTGPTDVLVELVNSTTVMVTRIRLPPLPWCRIVVRWRRWCNNRKPVKYTIKEIYPEHDESGR